MDDVRDKATETSFVPVTGGKVATYSFGDGDDTILFLQGGPGMRANYLIEAHIGLIEEGYRLVFFDPLGAGRSDRPADSSLWTIERFAEEVETVRKSLNLGDIQLYGHSWGAILSVEYLIRYPKHVIASVISHGFADTQFHQKELDRLTAALGHEFAHMRRMHELAGTTDSVEYQAGERVLWHKHICRMLEWPDELTNLEEVLNPDIYKEIIGLEFNMKGNLRDWNRLQDLKEVQIPALVLSGEYDALTPNEAQKIYQALPNSSFHLFRNVAHMPMYECPSEYRQVVHQFFKAHRKS